MAVYVHIPFCPSKCGYCDFNSYAMDGDIVSRTANALVQEIQRSPHTGRPAKTIFFGGGTPTFLPAEALLSILEAVREAHPPVPECEITSEANPGTVDAEKFAAMRGAGFNRLSIGVQSFDDDELRSLDRVHTADEVYRAYRAARDAGFSNVNLDLMFALPNQTLQAWICNLESALALAPEHLSLYCLTIEPNTRFYRLFRRGLLPLPPDETQREMYERTLDLTAQHGYEPYEISNFARPGFECLHNLCYWRAEEYVGYGPGAVERVGPRRWTHIKHPVAYCEAVERGEDLACESETLDPATIAFERLMLGLRLQEGISSDLTPDLLDRAEPLIQNGWLKLQDGRLRLTREGRHWCNRVVLELSA
ncbi:MAG: coproporphyrinogen III oxidase [Fimbriimonadales bacterium]|nr:MAG: coproporphyrinogen III oxidase [Fimbriimonadales bacterium]